MHDDQRARIQWEITRPLEAVRRDIEAATGDRRELWGLFEDLDLPRYRLSSVVRRTDDMAHRNAFIDAYLAIDEAAEHLICAIGDVQHGREPGDHLETTVRHISRAVDVLAA